MKIFSSWSLLKYAPPEELGMKGRGPIRRSATTTKFSLSSMTRVTSMAPPLSLPPMKHDPRT